MDHQNVVHIIGRVSSEPVGTVLPSGDEVVTVRVVVERPPAPAGRGVRRRIDVLGCAAWGARTRREVRAWCVGDLVEVHGAVRRRFWRAADRPQSRYEIEATSVRLLRAGDGGLTAPSPASPDPTEASG